MAICPEHVEPCHPGGDQACQSGEASQMQPQTWQTRLALVRMASCGPQQRNAPGAMRAALLSRSVCKLTACHPDWNVAECIRYAKRLAPELFQVHIQTHRKWLRSGHTHVRPAVLGPAHVTELVDLGQRISEGISCGSSVFRFAFNQRLEALGWTCRFGPREFRRFLRQMDLKWRQPAGEKRKVSDSDVRKHRELTARKLAWTLNDAGMHPSRLCNIDETATRLLPIGEKGWLRPGAAPIVKKAYMTTVLATRYGSPDLLAQYIFQEKTRACEPTHAYSSIPDLAHGVTMVLQCNVGGLCGVHRQDLVQSPRTSSYRCMGAVVGCMHNAHLTGNADRVAASITARASDVLAPWLHKPHATVRHQLHACSEGWPHPRSCQPLGLFAHHGPRRSHCSEAFIHGLEVHVPGLAAHRQKHTTTQPGNTSCHAPDECDSVLAAAQTDHAGGNLFTPHRRRPAPELLHVGAAEHDMAMGSGFIEEDGDVVDEDSDEAQLADEHFFVDELEDSRAGDEPSEPETVAAEPLPSAPADPVQILTRLQALRIVYGKCAPK